MSKKPRNQWVAISGMGFQLAATIFVGAYLGNYLDDHYPISERRIYTLLLVLITTAGSIYQVARQLNKEQE